MFVNNLFKKKISFSHFLAKVDAVECNVDPKNNEARLRQRLFCNYDKDSRPTLNDGPIMIKFKMIIKGFMFDDANGKLTVSTWLAMVRVTHNDQLNLKNDFVLFYFYRVGPMSI